MLRKRSARFLDAPTLGDIIPFSAPAQAASFADEFGLFGNHSSYDQMLHEIEAFSADWEILDSPSCSSIEDLRTCEQLVGTSTPADDESPYLLPDPSCSPFQIQANASPLIGASRSLDDLAANTSLPSFETISSPTHAQFSDRVRKYSAGDLVLEDVLSLLQPNQSFTALLAASLPLDVSPDSSDLWASDPFLGTQPEILVTGVADELKSNGTMDAAEFRCVLQMFPMPPAVVVM
jgi:hypothetical protein